MNNGRRGGGSAARRLFVRPDGQMDGENEERGKRKDIFIRIILQHRISSGKVAQCLVDTPPHTG